MVDNYAPPEPPILTLPGKSGRVALGMAVDGFAARGIATPHDVTVSGALADVLSGGDFDPLDAVTEDDVMALERKSFMELIRTKESLARIKSIVETGKPLRN
jgi:3-hydroxyacyl-CoA dehydrogenase